MPRRIAVGLLTILLFISGCATTNTKKSPDFDTAVKNIKTIALMPPDIEVYQLTAGGVRELIDEWTDISKQLTIESLKKYLGERYGFNVIVINEDFLKKNYKELWEANRSLYDACAISALLHAYGGPNTFPSKLKNFDYTLGEEINELSSFCGADALLFINGYDYEATAGRIALLCWNIFVGALTGVTVVPLNPSFMAFGLVDLNSGNIEWFKISPQESEYSFRNKKDINNLVEWLTRDFLPKE